MPRAAARKSRPDMESSRGAPRRTRRGEAPRDADELRAGLELAIEGVEEELRVQREAAVLRLPVAGVADDRAEALPDAVSDAIAPLLAELGRLRAEIAELRRTEAAEPVAAPSAGTDLFRLVVAIIVCFVLVATALVIVVKA